MAGYTVKIAELGKLIGDLETGADRMADANKKLSGGGAWGALGNEDLAKSGMDFEEAWEFGIGRLGEAAEGVTARLKTAQQKYQKMEEEFGGGLNKLAELIPDPADGPSAGGTPEPDGRGGPDLSPRFPLDDGGPVGGGYTGGITDILGGGR
ncbi:hypothetical protein [Amycolatopsis azurea]|uniref:Uncharacterized protein n=1 Tax=Amycolatopsis azurea DSM 43854 TaxID=1238180 RepID=M2QMP1_9PSEU|nr:hypothetical protein [Amycolatopsis azurea]EMD27102.1 hypothetical protein C791_2610 [Amycolatopsis azurea DSM 43854]OOC08689.1 hypothetical protein B0293_01945 [Amycolatopsis azurea DSM 43854]